MKARKNEESLCGPSVSPIIRGVEPRLVKIKHKHGLKSRQVTRIGEWIRLGDSVYRYRGEAEITWSKRNGLFRVNGRVVGIDLTSVSANNAVRRIRKYGNCIQSASWSNTQHLSPLVLRALKQYSAKGLGVQLVDFTGSSADLRRLRLLGEKLDAVFCVFEDVPPAGLRGLSFLDKDVQIGVSAGKTGDRFFRQLRGIKNLTRLEIAQVLPSNLFPRCLRTFKELRELNVDRLGYGVNADFVQYLPRLWKLSLAGIGGQPVTPQALKRLKNLRVLSLEKLPTGDGTLAFVTGLKKLIVLHLICGSQDAIQKKGLQRLGSLPQLKHLALTFCRIEEQAHGFVTKLARLKSLFLNYRNRAMGMGIVRHVGKLTNLRFLSVSGTSLGEDDLRALGALKDDLLQLGLHNNRIGNDSLKYLAGFRRLRALTLAENDIDDKGLAHIRRMEDLRSLSLRHTGVTSRGMRHVAALKKLRYLALGHTRVGDEGVRLLAGLSRLRYLELENTPIGDGALVVLGAMHSLRKVIVSRTDLSQEALRKFRKSNPRCVVVEKW